MPTTNDIRTAFLDYFSRHDHEIVPSSPLVPRNDPTLLFTNAGMVQFKNVFTGLEKRPYSRAATAQKCVRAGGKHNDLENVGYTSRHHTFFEMLGNFSFGDYFKELAIELAWNLVTKEFGLAKERMWITVHPSDEAARDLWRKIAGLSDHRIIGHADNVWAMGPIGPCGYCSEIFYDQGEKVPGGPPGSPDEDGDRFLEFWNLVFTQFDQVDENTRIDLPKPSIDTGMGLERITAILQRVTSNYDIDLFRTLIVASADASGVAPDGEHAVSHRVIADHLRASAFLIADGVLPSKEGRGYVLRRIMRRAMGHAHTMGVNEPLLWRLVPALVQQMGSAYGELLRAQPLITETLLLEETNFKQTLERGYEELRLLTGNFGEKYGPGLNRSQKVLTGANAFALYDSRGFPLDMTQDILRRHGMSVDVTGFEAEMGHQRERSRAAWVGSGEAATEAVWFGLRDEVGATEFLGYETESAEGVVVAILGNGGRVAEIGAGEEVGVVVNQTPFYAESGGQMGDTGIIFSPSGTEFAVRDTIKKAGDLFVHLGAVSRGVLHVGDVVELRIDGARRRRLRANHSVTHLLHQALRARLGEHVTQKGSLVAPDRLRFDFSHPRPLSPSDIRAIEAEVNAQIRENTAPKTRLLTPDRAVAEGALALFGEKYGDEVRVVAMGKSGPDRPFSVELCGGTHVRRTGDIGLFKIIAETAVAAGVRRIEALTGAAAEEHLSEEEQLLQQAAAALRSSPAELPARIATLAEERRRLERELADARRALASAGPAVDGGQKRVGAIAFDGRVIDGVPGRELRSLADDLKRRIGSGIVTVVSRAEGKAAIVVAVTPDLTNRFDAIALARLGAAALGGTGGGGRAEMAQAGGPQAAHAEAALAAVERAIAATA
jgi:alanyl-tRNA synthetase